MSADRPVRVTALAVLLLVAGLLAACGGSGSGQTASGNAFVFLTVTGFSTSRGSSATVADVTSNLARRNTTTSICATLNNISKNPTVTAPTALDNVVINQYTVSFNRLDGGPAPGPFTFNTAFLVPSTTGSGSSATAGGSVTVAIVLLPAQAKNEPPLLPRPQLPLNAVATVTFKGQDGRGQAAGTQGSISMTFIFDAGPEGGSPPAETTCA